MCLYSDPRSKQRHQYGFRSPMKFLHHFSKYTLIAIEMSNAFEGWQCRKTFHNIRQGRWLLWIYVMTICSVSLLVILYCMSSFVKYWGNKTYNTIAPSCGCGMPDTQCAFDSGTGWDVSSSQSVPLCVMHTKQKKLFEPIVQGVSVAGE